MDNNSRRPKISPLIPIIWVIAAIGIVISIITNPSVMGIIFPIIGGVIWTLIIYAITASKYKKLQNMSERERAEYEARREQRKESFKSLFSTEKLSKTLFVILLIAGVISIVIVSAVSKNAPDKASVVVIAEKAVKEKLKSPSTAEFSPMSETTATKSGDTWTVSGWVDAQNSFGATMRNNYTVVIKFSGNSYEVISCTVY